MAWFIGQLVLLLLLAFGLGLLLGYLLWIFGWRRSVTSTATAANDTVPRDGDVKQRQALEAEKRSLAVANRSLEDRIAQLEEELGTATSVGQATKVRDDATLADTRAELVEVRAELTDVRAELADVRARLADEESARAEAEVRRRAAEAPPPSSQPGSDERSGDIDADAGAGNPRPTLPEDVDARAHALVAEMVEPDEPDDLTRIEGVGPKIAGALDAAGIRTFRTLAMTGATELRTAIQDAGMRFAPSLPTWARQAAYLAGDDIDGFRDYTKHLVAGREPTSLRRR